MKFKTEYADAAYMEILENVSARAIKLYEEVKMMSPEKASDLDRFQMNMAISHFQSEGIARAISTGVDVDVKWVGLKSGIVLASSQTGD